ncbi:CocE/NonD family hydrolase [Phyllobacterium sp. 21LDTY02-6]|uniref:CocE/NonD family hydrolase n=1 Tax=Phyllobacterium sp. 21LDTY02-6 TaxID=2944903 RepID=UPI002021D96B|nr:CocE/NonD family hydrolase [Phyllobacterium sp. 21LDTY02-6]MCO4316440.1 CocE/NonD family hydrolase [Phyllobacterium sp. 21LDTY02-6]
MRTVDRFPRNIIEHADMGIAMPDGCRLSARVWMPDDASEQPVPAILEFLPYRKRDGTTARDNLTHPYFAGHGYACLRVDMRGNGDSEGLMEDEYSEQELGDACDVIAWIASQPWCSGTVGMMGISWGGFNSLQVAALQPPALKAIITLCSTDDRYADDIHYKGGLLLNENLGWGATMLAYSSRAPDPALRGEKWRDMWRERLENEPFLPAVWLRHQTRDAYWKRGSVCEDFASIKAATLAIGGWGDAYKNAVPRLMQGIGAPVKGIIGPWVHKYPHFAVPAPRIGFLQEALRWWDRWLKDIDTGVEGDPAYRGYLMDSVRPKSWYTERPGCWIAEPQWPSATIGSRSYHLGSGMVLADEAGAAFAHLVSSPQDCGMMGGEYCAIWLGPELPGDQRRDDALSLCYDRALDETIDIVGAPEISLTLASDRPVAMVAVRLCDVHPDGASTRITYGVFNLCHRGGHDAPQPLEPGQEYRISFKLDDIAYRIPAGHRLRVAVSSSYWPMVWPSPQQASLTLSAGRIDIPARKLAEGDEWTFAEPEAAAPWQLDILREAANRRHIEHDQVSGRIALVIEDDFGEARDRDHGLIHGGTARERWEIDPGDPLSARGETHWTEISGRDDWRIRTETFTTMRSDAGHFYLTGRIEAYENDELAFERDFDETIERHFI